MTSLVAGGTGAIGGPLIAELLAKGHALVALTVLQKKLRLWWNKYRTGGKPVYFAALVGSASAVGMFLTTVSFLLTTPGVWEASAGGFPALSVVPGQFLLKDVVLLGASLWMFGDDWRAQTACGSHGRENREART